MVKIPITIDQAIRSPIVTQTFEISDGYEIIPENVSLIYLQQLINTGQVITVKLLQNLVTFFSSESFSSISYPSNGIKISTRDYKVDYNGSTYTIDEFFSNYVTNFSDYLLSIVEESLIPYSMGIKPARDQLLASNFKVVQINKHVTNSNTISELNTWNAEKSGLGNDI